MATDSPFDRAFDLAFGHLATCRMAYEDDPRNPDNIAALGAARISLEEARITMNAERIRLGLQPRRLRKVQPTKIEGQPFEYWQTITPG